MSADRFGIPENVFGAHDDDFFGGVGRIALLSALIEYQALTIYQTMTHSPQHEYARLSVSQLIEQARRELGQIPDDHDRAVLCGYFAKVEVAMEQRNDFVHSLWPAQSGERLYGWRPSRERARATDNPNRTVDTTMDAVRSFVTSLVELVQDRDRVFASACSEQDRRLKQGSAE